MLVKRSQKHFLPQFFARSTYLWVLLFVITAPGCMSVFYAPNAQNVPLFTEKKEVNISGALQLSSFSTGVDIQVAGAVTDYLGIVANFNHWGGSWESTAIFSNETIKGSHKSNFGEIGVGYYLPFKDKFVFETYGGFGMGKVLNTYEENQHSNSYYNRYYIQPAIGWYYKNIKLILSTRFCGLDYRKIQLTANIDHYDLDEVIYLQDHPFSLLFEPAFTFRGGGKYVKFQAQIGLSVNMNNPYMKYDPLNLNLGVIFTIPPTKNSE